MVLYPTGGISQVFGLLDILRSYKGKTDIAKLNIDLRLDIDDLLPIIDTAEFVGLVMIEDGDISLTEAGKNVLADGMQKRKKIVGDQLKTTELFGKLGNMIGSRRKLGKEGIARVVEEIAGPVSNIDEAVGFTIRWGVFAELFGYNGSSLTPPLGAPVSSVS